MLAASATAVATGLGAIPVFLLGPRAVALRPALWGATVGLMGVASIVGLLLPAADEGSPTAVAAGLALGVAFSLLAVELVPQAFTRATWRSAAAGSLAGGALMLALAAGLGV